MISPVNSSKCGGCEIPVKRWASFCDQCLNLHQESVARFTDKLNAYSEKCLAASDPLNPPHYLSADGSPTIAVSADKPFCIGAAIKYLVRAGRKPNNPIGQDYNKALWNILYEMQREGLALTVDQAHIDKTRRLTPSVGVPESDVSNPRGD